MSTFGNQTPWKEKAHKYVEPTSTACLHEADVGSVPYTLVCVVHRNMHHAVRNRDVVVDCHEQRAREVVKVGRIVGICDVGVEEDGAIDWKVVLQPRRGNATG